MTERLLHQEEIEALIRRFGHPRRHNCTLEVSENTYNAWTRKISTGPVACRGEVIMVILRLNGNLLLHTKDFYPSGVYRLLSGRVLWQERVEETLHREVQEETSLDVKVERFLGLIEYEFRCQANRLAFVSYVFQLQELGGELCCIDTGERISDFREAPVTDLPIVAVQLEHLQPEWRDWGNFRAVAHRFVGEMFEG